ncbi:MAG: carboxypeptidase-like regulatory domain-containing protein, partial [Candidatus Moraniibacteriota bacterium]
MEKIKRTLFFWSLVLIFCIVTPIIVFQAKGYRFDWHRGVFVFSGTISFKANPQNISAQLNGVLSENKRINRINGAFNISGLLPDDYNLKISAPDFYPWDKKIDVHSGITSEFWNVVLT